MQFQERCCNVIFGEKVSASLDRNFSGFFGGQSLTHLDTFDGSGINQSRFAKFPPKKIDFFDAESVECLLRNATSLQLCGLRYKSKGFSEQNYNMRTKFIYKLGNSLYVPLTSRCNSLTLPQLRGEGFELPTSVVAALCRVRDAELHGYGGDKGSGEKKWYLDDCNSRDLPPKMKLPSPPFEYVASLPSLDSEREPKLDDLLEEIRQHFQEEQTIESIVISGEGEPTLRLDDTVELVQRIKTFADSLSEGNSPPAIRLTTNGLVPASSPSLPQTLYDSGVSNISVGLMTWNADQYNDLVKPLLPNAFETVCSFIQDAVNVDGDLGIETTAVDRPDVDKSKTEALATSLGVTTPVRWRPYFP